MEEMFEIERRGHVTVLSTSESLKANTAPILRNAVKKLCCEYRTNLVIDMRKMPSIDSAGCGALVSSLRGVRISDGEIKIAGPNERVLDTLKLTKLDRVFEIYQDLDEAIKSFSGPLM
ncbi:MAG: anti-sigma factor antagonist [Thermodesulfobacteriota bacterium]|nr:anti-sigma factor antagonist [Thermodesulfobacteriota bacterium]